jgi:glycosyltransferase involved in cell wall biosynthesis
MVRIAVDAFPLATNAGSGIANYLRNILSSLLILDCKNKYFLYCKDPIDMARAENVVPRFDSRPGNISRSFGNSLWLFSKGIRMMKKDNIDLLWGTRHMLPPYVSRRIRKILTVHDLVWHYYPETMDRYNLLIMGLLAERAIKAADHIIAVSEASARAISEITGIQREKISVIHHGTDRYIPLNKNDSAEFIADKYKTRKQYLLTVGTVEPRKNLKMLLRVFAPLKGGDYQLLIAGSSGWKTSPIYREYERLRLREEDVRFLGYIPDEDMNRLYSGAALFVFPSIYEGFGLPPLEAMASGTPVIVSNSSSLPEVVGDAGILLDPFDADSWRESITTVLSDAFLQERLTAKGLQRARLFSWKTAARKTLDIFEKFA